MVGLEYDPKILNFLNLVGQESGGRVENLCVFHLQDMIDEVIYKRKIQAHLIDIRNELSRKAELNIEILEEFIIKGEGR